MSEGFDIPFPGITAPQIMVSQFMKNHPDIKELYIVARDIHGKTFDHLHAKNVSTLCTFGKMLDHLVNKEITKQRKG